MNDHVLPLIGKGEATRESVMGLNPYDSRLAEMVKRRSLIKKVVVNREKLLLST